ncbi:MAG: LCP family protein [Clostridiaceae bacterium]
MGSNKNIIIWIGILALIGIILVMVACETGVLTHQQKPQPSAEPEKTVITMPGPETTQQEGTQLVTLPEEKTTKLTVGKPYSGKLVEEGTTNVLIIGRDKVNNLYDTIGIASINKKNKTLKFIMIPRDTYIEYNDEIISKLKSLHLDKEPGVFKINYAHHVGSKIEYSGKFKSGPTSFLAEVVKEKFGVEADDYVNINPSGFKELIDYLGGVDINVPYDMDYEDPSQDLYIHIKKGSQHLGGEDAEGFVRFRQGYREDGTFFEIGDTKRKENQLNFIKALIKQKGTIKNAGKIPGMISLLGKNIQHSIGLGDALQTYIGMAKDIISDKYEITTENLSSDKMIRVNGASHMVFD